MIDTFSDKLTIIAQIHDKIRSSIRYSMQMGMFYRSHSCIPCYFIDNLIPLS